MTRSIPALNFEDFSRRLSPISPEPLNSATLATLFAHFQELRRWNERLSLVGPGTAHEVLERHYGESLAALPLISPLTKRLLDLGSGAGFPGFVLAAARPQTRALLVEPREKKRTFLQFSARRGGLALDCLDARVASPLPDAFPATLELVTSRALKLGVEQLATLADRLILGGKILLWSGEETLELPSTLVAAREVPLPGSRARRIVELLARS